MNVKQAKKLVERKSRTAKGIACPCCAQNCKRYRRAFNTGMVRSLIWLVLRYQANGKKWINVPRVAPSYVLRSREFGKIKAWGLIVDRPNTDPAKRTSGFWKPTKRGIAFVYGRIKIPSHAIFYNRNREKFDGKPVSIRQTIGKKFDYEELMKDHP